MSRFIQNLQSAREIHQFNHDVDELKGWIAEKEAVLDSEDQDQDLQSIQTLLQQHKALEVSETLPEDERPTVLTSQCKCWLLYLQRDLVLISEEVTRRREESQALSRRHPHTRAAVTQRLDELDVCWTTIQDKASQRCSRLGQAEDVQKYFSNWNELM